MKNNGMRIVLAVLFNLSVSAMLAQEIVATDSLEQQSAPETELTSTASDNDEAMRKLEKQNQRLSRWTVGLITGLDIQSMRYSDPSYDIYDKHYIARGHFGLWADVQIIKGFSLRPQIQWIGRGVRMTYDDIDYRFRPIYFDMRLPFVYTFLREKKVQPYLLVAPSLNFAAGGKIKYQDATTTFETKQSKGSIYGTDFGFYFAAGVKGLVHFGSKFEMELGGEFGYYLGLVNTFSNAERNSSYNTATGAYYDALGTRKNGGFELSFTAGVPLRQFARSTPRERKQREPKEPTEKRKTLAQLRRERAEAERERAQREAELLRLLQEKEAAKKVLWEQQLADYNNQLKPANRVGDGIDMYVTPNVELQTAEDGSQEMNLVLDFGYQTKPADEISLKYDKNTDDYPAGKYLPTESKACKATLAFIKEKIDGEMAEYFTKGTKVTIKITGETDGSPIRNTIPYKGEFGDFNQRMIYLNNYIDDMTVTKAGGISSNGQLAFLRTQGVQQYLETYVDKLQATDNSYQIYAVEREEKGSQFRKISVEFTIHRAFNQELDELQKQIREEAGIMDTAAFEDVITISDVDENIPSTNKANTNTYVLIIANEQYNDVIGRVPFAENDGDIFMEYCSKTLGVPLRQIREVKNATKNQIMDALDWLEGIANARKGTAQVILYYAGHGVPISNATFLLPVDANPEKSEQMIALNELYSRLTAMPLARVVCYMDACFSGTRRNGQPLLTGGRGINVQVRQDVLQGNILILSAASSKQTAYPLTEQKHGMFTYYLLKSLQQSKGQLTFGEQFDKISEDVELEAALKGREQTPTAEAGTDATDTWRQWKVQ